jgi:small subunit ribosomal protein S21
MGSEYVTIVLNKNDSKERRLTKVKLRPNESQESLLRRFRKKVTRDRVMTEVRKRRWFMSPSEQRRLAKKKAIRRMKRRERRGDER